VTTNNVNLLPTGLTAEDIGSAEHFYIGTVTSEPVRRTMTGSDPLRTITASETRLTQASQPSSQAQSSSRDHQNQQLPQGSVGNYNSSAGRNDNANANNIGDEDGNGNGDTSSSDGPNLPMSSNTSGVTSFVPQTTNTTMTGGPSILCHKIRETFRHGHHKFNDSDTCTEDSRMTK
jgi:hypothetical protein